MTPPRRFKGCLTAWAIHCAIYRWQLIEWRDLARIPAWRSAVLDLKNYRGKA